MKDAVGILREDLDEKSEDRNENMMDISIPQKRFESEKTFNEISSRFEHMNSDRSNEFTRSNQMRNNFNIDFNLEESKRMMIESKLDYEI